MALDARIVCLYVIHARRILNICPRRLRHVFAAGSVASFAAHIPFGYAMIGNVEIHGMAAIAKRARRTLRIVRWVKRRPPIRFVGNEVRPPDVIRDVPLRWLRIIVIADFRKVTLLPNTAVDERNIVSREFVDGIGRQIGNYGLGMLARIADYVGHGRFLPACINFGVAGLACPRTHVFRWKLGLWRTLSRRLRPHHNSVWREQKRERHNWEQFWNHLAFANAEGCASAVPWCRFNRLWHKLSVPQAVVSEPPHRNLSLPAII